VCTALISRIIVGGRDTHGTSSAHRAILLFGRCRFHNLPSAGLQGQGHRLQGIGGQRAALAQQGQQGQQGQPQETRLERVLELERVEAQIADVRAHILSLKVRKLSLLRAEQAT